MSTGRTWVAYWTVIHRAALRGCAPLRSGDSECRYILAIDQG
jgi:hypothetical protein